MKGGGRGGVKENDLTKKLFQPNSDKAPASLDPTAYPDLQGAGGKY